MAAQTQDHKLRQERPGGCLNLGVAMVAADYPVNAFVYLSDDYEVTDIAAADKPSLGEVVKPATAAGGKGTVATRFRRVMEDVEAGGAIVVGDYVKSTTDSAASGQRVQKWDPSSDKANTIIGQALEAASAAGVTIDVGVF